MRRINNHGPPIGGRQIKYILETQVHDVERPLHICSCKESNETPEEMKIGFKAESKDTRYQQFGRCICVEEESSVLPSNDIQTALSSLHS